MNDMTAMVPALAGPTHYEMAAAQAAAQIKATVEARYVMALKRPRNWDAVRQDLLRECRRPSFANNKSALYNKPIGKGVEGLGIRFVEVAFRCMTNVLIEQVMTYEDEVKEVHRVTVTDLDIGNVTYNDDVKVSKTVERAKPMDDGSYLSVRRNSYDKLVYTVPANDDDLLNKRNALVSKSIRTLGLRIIPGDLQDECEEVIRAVRLDEAAKDPASERKRVADAFDSIGVRVAQLASYLGHDIGTCTPAELVNLRGLFGAMRDGEATWATVMENKAAGSGEDPPPPPPPPPPEVDPDTGEIKPRTAAQKAREALRNKVKGKGAPPAQKTAPEPAEPAQRPLLSMLTGHPSRPRRNEHAEQEQPRRGGCLLADLPASLRGMRSPALRAGSARRPAGVRRAPVRTLHLRRGGDDRSGEVERRACRGPAMRQELPSDISFELDWDKRCVICHRTPTVVAQQGDRPIYAGTCAGCALFGNRVHFDPADWDDHAEDHS